ncbi:uncharacterized protein LOC135369867 [Ornithodoros turicata]|uniref:uncharacterized protein LOC135369867 n=1 Tax=Ornithodoros turicata TaxID=34597 RepID=UPI003139C630
MAVLIGLQNSLRTTLYTTLWASFICFASGAAQSDGQCSPEKVAKCSEGIRNFLGTMDEVTLASDPETLDKHCRAIKVTKDCLLRETSRCPEVIRGIYISYLRPFNTIFQDLCQAKPQRQAYLKHAPCLNSMAKDGGPCNRSYERVRAFMAGDQDWTADNSTLPVFCCYFYSFYNCLHTQTERRCGKEAHEIFTRYTDYLNGNAFAGACNRYTANTDCDPVADSRSAASSTVFNGVALSTMAVSAVSVLLRPTTCPRRNYC